MTFHLTQLSGLSSTYTLCNLEVKDNHIVIMITAVAVAVVVARVSTQACAVACAGITTIF